MSLSEGKSFSRILYKFICECETEIGTFMNIIKRDASTLYFIEGGIKDKTYDQNKNKSLKLMERIIFWLTQEKVGSISEKSHFILVIYGR